MSTLFELLITLFILGSFAFFRIPKWVWIPVGVIVLLVLSLSNVSWLWLVPIWLIFIAVVSLLIIPQLRLMFLTKPLLTILQKVLPHVSPTERIALEAGDIWWESELFCGRPDWKKMLSMAEPKMNAEERAFLDNQVEKLCQMLNDWKITHDTIDLPSEVWSYLKQERFFGMVIPKEYGGRGFSALTHSTVVIKIASHSVSAAVNTMVPNSLGPAELLHQYGTEEQKNYYLPRLARGEEIPCFALTGPEAGSDAAAMTDRAFVCRGEYQGTEVLGMRITWDKRYITLAPAATLLGLAFKLYDPDRLLGGEENIGITLCLIPTSHPGVEIGLRHYPLSAAFLNGPTRGKDVFIPLEWIIGGPKMAGFGWQMLMECLSIGRGISLPALATATGKLCYRTTGAYAMLRRQFKMPIAKFDGVEAALANIAGYTYLLEAVRIFSADAVDQNIKPTLASAITKYHLTEIGRKVINEAMDIHGGRGIQLGPRNYLGRCYENTPISITVEGANILTRNLIIFGQGAIRCHPYLFQEMELLSQQDNPAIVEQFDKLLIPHIGFAMSNLIRTGFFGLTGGHLQTAPVSSSVTGYYRQLTRMSSALALVSDVSLLLLGGELKRKERLSARLGDVLSYLYLGSAVLKYFSDHGDNEEDLPSVHWVLQTCLFTIQEAFEDFFANAPFRVIARILWFLVFPYGRPYKKPSDELCHELVGSMLAMSKLRERLTRYCYIGETNDPVGRVEYAFMLLTKSEEAQKKMHQALHSSSLPPYATYEQQIEVALSSGKITAEEAQLLSEYEKARMDAMQVDEFTTEELCGALK